MDLRAQCKACKAHKVLAMEERKMDVSGCGFCRSKMRMKGGVVSCI